MSIRGVVLLLLLVVGAVLGGIIGWALGGGSEVSIAVGAGIGAALGPSLMLIPTEVWEGVGALFELLSCCAEFAVLLLSSLATLGGWVLWQNMVGALLAGGGILLLLISGVVLLSWRGCHQPRAMGNGLEHA